MMNRYPSQRRTTALTVALMLIAAGRMSHADDKPPAARPGDRADAKSKERPPDGLSQADWRKLGQLMDRDWKDRPEWAEMLVMLLKQQPMRVGGGWFRASQSRFNWKSLASRFDHNRDGRIEAAELPKGAENSRLLFERLDRNQNGEIQADDLDWTPGNRYERDQQSTRQLFYRLDTDSNGRISKKEMQAFYAASDREGRGFLTPEDLHAAFNPPRRRRTAPRRKQDGPPPLSAFVKMLLAGELGSLTRGPAVGQQAPEFQLPAPDGKQTISLSQFRGKPVVLVFGSFT